MNNLYILTTRGLGDFHVLANDPTEALNSLEKILNNQEYGFSDDRKVINIKLVTQTLRASYNEPKKPFLSDKSTRLLIVKDWL